MSKGILRGGKLEGMKAELVKQLGNLQVIKLLESKGDFKEGDTIYLGSVTFEPDPHTESNTVFDLYHVTADGHYHVCAHYGVSKATAQAHLEDKTGKRFSSEDVSTGRCHGNPMHRVHYVFKVQP